MTGAQIDAKATDEGLANPKRSPYDYFLREGGAAARSLGVELVSSPVETAADIERVIDIEVAGHEPNGALLFPPGLHDLCPA
jgi:hypothetical protein